MKAVLIFLSLSRRRIKDMNNSASVFNPCKSKQVIKSSADAASQGRAKPKTTQPPQGENSNGDPRIITQPHRIRVSPTIPEVSKR